jgi:lecithin:cholesterol acyltransferase
MPKNLVIILVPGGMGTTLSLGSKRVWDFEFPFHLEGARMINDPALLVPWLPLAPGNLLSVYNDLVKFIVKHGYVKNTDLFLWGYDWRQGMAVSAQALADFVNSLNLAGKKILFITHSFGCMVLRWGLLFGTPANPGVPMIDSALVDQVVAAGPPMLGIAGAFKDLIRMPRINDIFDLLFSLLRAVDPSLAGLVSVPINKALMSLTAQLESLVPNNIPMLSGGSSPPVNPFGVFDWHAWPDELKSLRTAVQATQAQLQATNWGAVTCTVIASQNYATDTGYLLDGNDGYASDWPPADGDDAVLLTSAKAYCPTVAPLLVNERHRTLLDDPVARTFLDSII